MLASARGGGPMVGPAGWPGLASYLAASSEEERASFSRYTALGLPDEREEVGATLLAHAAQNLAATRRQSLTRTVSGDM